LPAAALFFQTHHQDGKDIYVREGREVTDHSKRRRCLSRAQRIPWPPQSVLRFPGL
jgi:hypothetical protein